MTRILVIDDDAELRLIVRHALEVAGHQVAEAADGAEGIAAFRRDPFDLVITDLFMSEKDGLAVTRDLRSEFGDVKIIAISGGSDRIAVDFLPVAKQFGAKEVLHKPFGMDTLLAAVDRVLAGIPRWPQE